jgi:hypothetical protein
LKLLSSPSYLPSGIALAALAFSLSAFGQNALDRNNSHALLAASLPDSPSTLLLSSSLPAPGFAPDPSQTPQATPYTAAVIVNGRPYHFPTPHEQAHAYLHELIGPFAFVRAGIRAGIEQARDTPSGWGQDFPGFLQRYGSAYGEAALRDTIVYGMSQALHEDDRYLVCHRCSFGDKVENAALAEFTARRGVDGHRVFSPTPIAASIGAPMIAYAAWYPPGNSPTLSLRHVAFSVATRFAFDLVLREWLFDRDTKEEKEAAKAEKAAETSAAQNTKPAPVPQPATP